MAYKGKFDRYGPKMKGILLEDQSTSATSPLQKGWGGIFVNNRPPSTTTIVTLALIGE
jgi:hypothetical protein